MRWIAAWAWRTTACAADGTGFVTLLVTVGLVPGATVVAGFVLGAIVVAGFVLGATVVADFVLGATVAAGFVPGAMVAADFEILATVAAGFVVADTVEREVVVAAVPFTATDVAEPLVARGAAAVDTAACGWIVPVEAGAPVLARAAFGRANTEKDAPRRSAQAMVARFGVD